MLSYASPIILIILYVFFSIKQINQYERGVKFRLGKYVGIMEPGWKIVFPLFEGFKRVDIRVKAVDVPDQEAMTRDNVSVRINAVIYYKISQAEKSVIEVENYYYAMSQLAQTTMRNIIGEVTLDELLTQREFLANKIQQITDKASDPWGITVKDVSLKDIILPEEMKRVIAKQAEAEREKRAVIIKAEGEVMASQNMAQAARTLSSAHGALHLKTLQSIKDLSSDQSNTIVFAVPLEILRAFERFGQTETKAG
ncbi:MAG: slipin family protein [Candidatus Saganbacteria bacterium]|nr:slipin family protein [Candidatus Saganbacteria bacterium]